eukprot:320552-Chlamydomonas_euryale.AAC.28
MKVILHCRVAASLHHKQPQCLHALCFCCCVGGRTCAMRRDAGDCYLDFMRTGNFCARTCQFCIGDGTPPCIERVPPGAPAVLTFLNSLPCALQMGTHVHRECPGAAALNHGWWMVTTVMSPVGDVQYHLRLTVLTSKSEVGGT